MNFLNATLHRTRLAILWATILVCWCLALGMPPAAQSQESQNQATGPGPIDAQEIQSILDDEPAEQAMDQPFAAAPSHIDLLSLIARGGGFMIPIGLMSLLVVALASERIMALRRSKIVPAGLIEEIRSLSEMGDAFNPSDALRACQDHPSPAADVIEGMLMRTGQNVGEIENAATEIIQREADRYSAPIRWLNLAAAATPLMGLLGTVWGMIKAFHESTTLTPDRSRSEQLSEGIYTALVTTLAGLIVAIPAAILAQYLENRLAKLFHRIEDLAFELAPRMAMFTGRRRLDIAGALQPFNRAEKRSEASPPAPPPVAKRV